MSEVEGLRSVVAQQSAYIEKLLQEIDALEDRCGARQIVNWELEEV